VLTIFTCPKPFRGRAAAIQRNALHSWTLLHPAVQIILFGDAEGSQEVAWELGIRYEERPQVTASGSARLDYVFRVAQQQARYNTLCYVPCDTVLMEDFYQALTRVEALYREFLMVGRACHLHFSAPLQVNAPVQVNAPLHFGMQLDLSDADWQGSLRQRTERADRADGGIQSEHAGYVAFSKGACLADLPALAMDSPLCANWLLWKALSDQVPVVDASEMVLAVEQCGETHCAGRRGGETVESAAESLALCGNGRQLRTVAKVPYLLISSDVVRRRWQRWHRWKARAERRGDGVLRGWQEMILQLREITGTASAQGARGASVDIRNTKTFDGFAFSDRTKARWNAGKCNDRVKSNGTKY